MSSELTSSMWKPGTAITWRQLERGMCISTFDTVGMVVDVEKMRSTYFSSTRLKYRVYTLCGDPLDLPGLVKEKWVTITITEESFDRSIDYICSNCKILVRTELSEPVPYSH